MKITPTSLSINLLLGSTNEQYVIPTYQRRYSWHEKQIWELIEDIELIEGGDTHLLGSIVCLAGHHIAGLNKLELVDGQQRLTTISIILHCIRQKMDELGEKNAASEVARLLSAKALGGNEVPKVVLDSIDKDDFEHLVKRSLDHQYKNASLQGAFEIVREWCATQNHEQLASFLYRLINQAIVIRLDVSEAKDAFKLFETINNRGLKLSPTDIIKNFLLGNAARFGTDALESARCAWAALLANLDGTDADAFFRYYLMSIIKARVTATEVVASFKKIFMNQVKEARMLPERHLYSDAVESTGDGVDEDNGLSDELDDVLDVKTLTQVNFVDFLSSLVRSAKVYGELVLVKTNNKRLDNHLRNLRMIKASQTYGLLMHLRVGGCGDKQLCEVLRLTESFILRRHICRERSNETEALFAKLCAVAPSSPVVFIRDAYKNLCPSDDKFYEDFRVAQFSANLIDRARYCLEQFEIRKHGNYDELQVLGSEHVHVEHVIPQKIKTKKAKEEFGDWVEYLGDKAESLHPKYVGLIGNLTLFAGPLNISASNNPFGRKKQSYKQSAILLTCEIASMKHFRFKNVEERSTMLANMALEIWPMP